ncbi:MAG: GntR family transcriptional regulator [Acidobacteriota bacterium]
MTLSKLKAAGAKPMLLVEHLTNALSEAIMSGDLKGGAQLVETELQKAFGISRTPLREAFRELEKRGMVVIIPRKGTFVRTLTLKDIDDTFPILAQLEGFAAREALGRMTGEDFARLEGALAEMEAAARSGDAEAYLEPHVRFHDAYIKASGNDLLPELLGRLKMRIVWHRFYFKYHQEDFPRFLREHRMLLDKLRNPATTAEEMEQAVRNDIYSAYKWVRRHIQAGG